MKFSEVILTAAEVKPIRDQLGGTKAMAERLEVTPRAVRHLMRRGVKRPKLQREIRGLVGDIPCLRPPA